VLASRPDGVILPSPFCDAPGVVARLLADGAAVTALASGAPPHGASAVTIDDREAAVEMTRHLLDLGHRRIGFVGGARNQVASIRRLEGYRQALDEAGLRVDEALIVPGDFTYRSGLTAADRLLDLPSRPTAIFASNDDMAAAVVAAAHRRRLDVPGDLSVCGFDDTALATTISPELTTVHQPVAEMARAAVEILAAGARARRRGREATPEIRLFRHEIVRRQSDTAAPS
jgi:LacI family transcriptional regulator